MEKAAAGNDRIYNGANDDGSGTVSVIALAEAFAHLHVKPKRSLVFMTFCGEELGLLWLPLLHGTSGTTLAETDSCRHQPGTSGPN